MQMTKKLLLVPALVLIASSALAGNGTIGSFSRSATAKTAKLPVKVGVNSLPVRQVQSNGLARSGQIGEASDLFYIKNSGLKNYSEYYVAMTLSGYKSKQIDCASNYCDQHFYLSGNKVMVWLTTFDYDAGKAQQADVQVGVVNAAGDVVITRPLDVAEVVKPTRPSAFRGMITGFGTGMGAGSQGFLNVYMK